MRSYAQTNSITTPNISQNKLSPEEREQVKELRRMHIGEHAERSWEFVDGILAGLARLGGARLDIVDRVAVWFMAGHRKEPTGRPPGRPKGAKDSRPRKPYQRKNLPADT